MHCFCQQTVWPSGLRRWLQAPVRKGVGSNPTAVILKRVLGDRCKIHNFLGQWNLGIQLRVGPSDLVWVTLNLIHQSSN